MAAHDETSFSASFKPRRRGRPAGADTTQITKDTVFRKALELARHEPLHQITIAGLAKELGVTPALIHYLIPGRDGLISGVMNAFYEALCQSWPLPADGWREQLISISRHIYSFYCQYRGVVLYTTTYNRYRVVQIVAEDETDYGLLFLDRLIRSVEMLGLDTPGTALFCEILVDFLSGQAKATVGMRRPREHENYLRDIFNALDPAIYPGIARVHDEMFKIDSSLLFEKGLEMLMDAFSSHRADMIDVRASIP